jgi:hypothetical protein
MSIECLVHAVIMQNLYIPSKSLLPIPSRSISHKSSSPHLLPLLRHRGCKDDVANGLSQFILQNHHRPLIPDLVHKLLHLFSNFPVKRIQIISKASSKLLTHEYAIERSVSMFSTSTYNATGLSHLFVISGAFVSSGKRSRRKISPELAECLEDCWDVPLLALGPL